MYKIPVGVSQCLLGDEVRYNGGHKHSRYLTQVLSQYFTFQSACPEVAIGLGVPREPIRLVATGEGTRVRGSEDESLDVTDALVAEAEAMAEQMPDICGYIFMQKSPTCGLFNIKRYTDKGMPRDSDGQGAYARRLTELMPLVPMEEAGRLNDPGLRENFITRVFALNDWRQSVSSPVQASELVAFYSRYKYQVMAHHVPAYQSIGRLLADLSGKHRLVEDIAGEFLTQFMDALSHQAGRKGNTNVMRHLQGYLKGELEGDEKTELGELIEAYRRGEVPLVVPMTLLKHHLRKVDMPYLQQQTFWSPHPEKLGLRNQNAG